jgi:hypothetical protein
MNGDHTHEQLMLTPGYDEYGYPTGSAPSSRFTWPPTTAEIFQVEMTTGRPLPFPAPHDDKLPYQCSICGQKRRFAPTPGSPHTPIAGSPCGNYTEVERLTIVGRGEREYQYRKPGSKTYLSWDRHIAEKCVRIMPCPSTDWDWISCQEATLQHKFIQIVLHRAQYIEKAQQPLKEPFPLAWLPEYKSMVTELRLERLERVVRELVTRVTEAGHAMAGL